MRDSADLSETSEDAGLDDVGHDSINFVGKMVRSGNAVDRGLISYFKLSQEEHLIQAETKGKFIKIKGAGLVEAILVKQTTKAYESLLRVCHQSAYL